MFACGFYAECMYVCAYALNFSGVLCTYVCVCLSRVFACVSAGTCVSACVHD